MSASSPIADLTYRNYDGPMGTTDMRWWAIAKMTIKMSVKRRGFITWSILSAWYFMIMIAVMYFMDVLSKSSGAANPFLSQVKWKNEFLHGFGTSQWMLFAVALLIGVGTIANDNRANALLIYLSKPCSKVDYLFGKCVGLFIVFYGVALAPSMLFWLYAAMSFREYGSVSQAPLLPLQLLVLAAIPALLLTSLCVGISSMFKQGSTAGYTFAGVFVFPNVFTVIMGGLYITTSQTPVLKNLYYASVDGLSIGMGKLLLGTDGSPMLGGNNPVVPRPDAPLIFLAYFGLCAVSILVAWVRIRPVEVIG